MRICFFLAMFICLGLPSFAYGALVRLPGNLSKSQRVTALQIVGFGTAQKILSDPYPLGGYSGFEAGVSVENFPAEDLGRLGSGVSAPPQDYTLSKVSIGKGFYNHLDLFLHFTPYTKTDDVAQHGGILRWGFFQSEKLPLNLSTLIHVNSANVSNQMTTRAYGIDILGGVNVEHLALFAGIGLAEATGTFTGGAAGMTDTGALESEITSSVHTVVGADIRISNIFISLQIDRYTLPVFSGKMGMRF